MSVWQNRSILIYQKHVRDHRSWTLVHSGRWNVLSSRACVSALPHLHEYCKCTELKVCCDRTLSLPLISWMLAASQGRCAYFDNLAAWNEWNHFVLYSSIFAYQIWFQRPQWLLNVIFCLKPLTECAELRSAFQLICTLFSSDPIINYKMWPEPALSFCLCTER